MFKPALIRGCIVIALAVIFGAFGAHGLKPKLTPEMLAVFEKGVSYQFYHGFALIIAGILHQNFPKAGIRLAAVLFTLGIILFSGSLYLIVVKSISGESIGPAGILTPIGGLCFIAGWIALLVGIINKK